MIMVPRPLQFGVSGAAQEVPAGLCFQASEVVASFHIFLGHHLEVSAQGIYMGALGEALWSTAGSQRGLVPGCLRRTSCLSQLNTGCEAAVGPVGARHRFGVRCRLWLRSVWSGRL